MLCIGPDTIEKIAAEYPKFHRRMRLWVAWRAVIEHMINRARQNRSRSRAIFQKWVADRPGLKLAARKYVKRRLMLHRSGKALVQAATARPSKQPRDPLRDVADKLQALHSKLAGLRKERRKLEEEESKLEAEATELTDRLRKHIPAANLQSARRKHIPALLSWRSPPLAPAM